MKIKQVYAGLIVNGEKHRRSLLLAFSTTPEPVLATSSLAAMFRARFSRR